VSATRFELTFEHLRWCASCARLNARAAVAAAQPLRPSIVDVSGAANEKQRTGTVRFREPAPRALTPQSRSTPRCADASAGGIRGHVKSTSPTLISRAAFLPGSVLRQDVIRLAANIKSVPIRSYATRG
jgi:hypothetical protein